MQTGKESSVSDQVGLSLSLNGSLEEGDECKRKKSTDALAKGLLAMLADVIRDFDSKADNALKSQDQLSSDLNRLCRELDQLLEDAPLPFIMQHAARISGVRKRVSSLNSLLKSVQQRVDNIERMISDSMQQPKHTSH